MVLRVTEGMLGSPGADSLVADLHALQSGEVPGVVSGPLHTLLAASYREPMDWLDTLPAGAKPLVTAPQPSARLPWEEVATRPLGSVRTGSLARTTDNAALQAILARSRNPFEQIEILGLLWTRCGPDSPTLLDASVRSAHIRGSRTEIAAGIHGGQGHIDIGGGGIGRGGRKTPLS